MKTYIDRDNINALLEHHLDDWCGPEYYACSIIQDEIDDMPPADVKEVVRGRWERCGGDLHSSGYAIFCSACNKVHFVHYKYSLGGLNCKELFEQPNYCPNCGAKMDGDGNA